ncbi:MAG: hypothetical protein RBT61_07995 [Candidatus Kapabacteria bacterium]|jgi:hypothetical protein|nr:hypothetical protein [Candidatus Kapabacteria bacterium]
MFSSLKKDFKVITIAVTASSKLCLDRVRNRDGSIHVNISDEQVTRINKMVDFRKLQTDFVIINERESKFDLIQELKSLIN